MKRFLLFKIKIILSNLLLFTHRRLDRFEQLVKSSKLLILFFKHEEKILLEKVIKRLLVLMRPLQIILLHLVIKNMRKQSLNQRMQHLQTRLRKRIRVRFVKVHQRHFL